MVTVQEATEIVMKNCFVPALIQVPLTDATGKVLGQKVFADRDLPPFDRVTMDGIAIAYDSFLKGLREFAIERTQAAGQPSMILNDPSNAIEVMTGAPLPEGTDTVIRYEDLEISEGTARVIRPDFQRGQNIHTRASDAGTGELLLEPGTMISPAETALLASTGFNSVTVGGYPATAIVSGGDELVAIDSVPEIHQIRRSNTYAIHAAMKELNWHSTMHHFPDDKRIIKNSLEEILGLNDVVILSGGVSKGKFDFIPESLTELGIKKLFHGVSQRPGKPLWFGSSDQGKIVFALPGNPVSTFMCFHRYVRPWFLKSLGVAQPSGEAILAMDLSFDPALTYFLQVRVVNKHGTLLAFPEAGGGSGDFANLRAVTGFLELPLEKNRFQKGEGYPYISFR